MCTKAMCTRMHRLHPLTLSVICVWRIQVWRSTTQMGCGAALAPVLIPFPTGPPRDGGCLVVVCRYFPPGNIAADSEYEANGRSERGG